MKHYFLKSSALLLTGLLVFSCSNPGPYVDGTYFGLSKSVYKSESFYGKVIVVVKNGHIFNVDFKIMDLGKNELFDDKYERHYAGNQTYIDQCRNDWKGVLFYPVKLKERQQIERVDAVSGATWSYNLFASSVKEAMKSASVKK
ncbi:MAG: FMN-binding protein [Bacteroidota bacterium]|nr:FMN-binding protein [Bacteroidota bacterium]